MRNPYVAMQFNFGVFRSETGLDVGDLTRVRDCPNIKDRYRSDAPNRDHRELRSTSDAPNRVGRRGTSESGICVTVGSEG